LTCGLSYSSLYVTPSKAFLGLTGANRGSNLIR